jgi:hypothetical protein
VSFLTCNKDVSFKNNFIIVDKIEQEKEAYTLDVDTFWGCERIRRICNHCGILNNLIEVLNKINEKL